MFKISFLELPSGLGGEGGRSPQIAVTSNSTIWGEGGMDKPGQSWTGLEIVKLDKNVASVPFSTIWGGVFEHHLGGLVCLTYQPMGGWGRSRQIAMISPRLNQIGADWSSLA